MVHIVLSKADLDEKLLEAGDKLVVIDFFANWCGPCRIMDPKVEELANKYSEQAVLLKVNVDDLEEIVLEYNVTNMPTFIFIKEKKVLDVFIGSNSEQLAKNVEKFIVTQPAKVVDAVETVEAEENVESEIVPN